MIESIEQILLDKIKKTHGFLMKRVVFQ